MENPAKEISSLITTLLSGSPQEQSLALQKYFTQDCSFTHPFCRVPSFSSTSPNGGSIPFASRTILLQILKWYRILSPNTQLKIHSTVFDSKTNTIYIKTSQIFSIWFIPYHKTPPVNLVTVLQLEPSSGAAAGQLPNGISSRDEEEGNETMYDAAEETRHLIAEGEKPSFAEVVENGPEATTNTNNNNNSAQDGKTDKKSKSNKKSGGSRPKQGNGHASGSGNSTATKYYIKSYEDLYQVNEFLKFLTLGFGAWTYMVWQLFATLVCVIGVGILGPVMKLVAPKEWEGKGVSVQ
ncbi:hypothetical protein QBC38DRAFT_180382 [Podospora fimiseda]|uniref:SigF-like NTF2-like domain-containing protein n=1 Tax=Podospora fimiseda TaxID=252190 RepID=A0AAN7BQS0_9PEZI|nr:hypothetical protein QBC38DRAFT_180382 [Podospora fimiseda]